MRGAVRRRAGQGAAGVGAVVTLAVAGWLLWLLPGPQLAAVLGFGPVDGVVTVSRCYRAADAEGYSAGTECEGRYTPRRAGRPTVGMVVSTAAEEYRPGTEVEVRTAGDRAYELSGTAVFSYGAGAGLLLVPFLALAAWLAACARRGAVANADGYVLAALAGLVGVIALALAAGVLVGAGTLLL